MSLIDTPLARATSASAGGRGATVRAMEVGQHVMTVLLVGIGIIRAIGQGTAPAAAIAAGLGIIAAHTVASLLPKKARTTTVYALWLVGFAVVWLAAVAVSPEFVWVSFVLWILAGHLLPLLAGLVFSVFVLAVVIVAPILHHGTTSYANVFGPLIGGVFAFGISRGYLKLLRDAAERERLVSSLTRAQEEMAALQGELALAQRHSGAVAERTRISRDIHDTIAQALSSIRLLAHAGADHTGDPTAIRTLGQVESLASDSLADVRRIVASLAPHELEDGALTAALNRMLERLHDETGVAVTLNVDDTLPLLPTDVEVALLRTAQSALANVRLHAQATRVVMSLIDAGDTVRLDITDDGRGFDVVAWESSLDTHSSSYGIRFMRARLRELGGGLDVESAPGEGAALSLHLPIAMPLARNVVPELSTGVVPEPSTDEAEPSARDERDGSGANGEGAQPADGSAS
ncbi:sensor histidine kinase [Microbacterium sp. NC79]|uniref:sensor histidine kinase n=1 Tax=Microbacterium sp. NC79 TaxID=2851009 RepID=UPI001C2C216D|nr:sensor histidine kinase [Microbacterium sp. NC79]MBV0895986.1 sensor histidine kinase [Microbacterium sp. NC79]